MGRGARESNGQLVTRSSRPLVPLLAQGDLSELILQLLVRMRQCFCSSIWLRHHLLQGRHPLSYQFWLPSASWLQIKLHNEGKI